MHNSSPRIICLSILNPDHAETHPLRPTRRYNIRASDSDKLPVMTLGNPHTYHPSTNSAHGLQPAQVQ